MRQFCTNQKPGWISHVLGEAELRQIFLVITVYSPALPCIDVSNFKYLIL